jgi:hypothetical protein
MTLWNQNVRSNRGDQLGGADIEIQSSRNVLLVELHGCMIDAHNDVWVMARRAVGVVVLAAVQD